MTTIMPPNVTLPSYECSKRAGVLDKKFQKEVDGLVFAHNRFDGQVIGGGADAYMANADVINLKGIGKARAHLLHSRMFGIQTIGDLASFTGDFDAPWRRLTKDEAETFRSLRAALQTCSLPTDGRVGRHVTVSENDPGMEAYVYPGKDLIQHNAGKEGAAYIDLYDHPTNNGFVASYLNVELSGYSASGRRPGSHIDFEPVSVAIGPGLPATTYETAEALKRALEEKNLSVEIERLPEFHMGLPRNPVRIKVWTDLVVD
jgi:hypothetical protein